jgi:hypothetical protein
MNSLQNQMVSCSKCQNEATILCKGCSDTLCRADWEAPHVCEIAGRPRDFDRIVFVSMPSYSPAGIVAQRFKVLLAPYFPGCQLMAMPGADATQVERWEPEFIFIVTPWLAVPREFNKAELEYLQQFRRICKNVLFLCVEQLAGRSKWLVTINPGDGGGGFGLGTAEEVHYAPRLVYDYGTNDLAKRSGEDLPQNMETLEQLQAYVKQFSPRVSLMM